MSRGMNFAKSVPVRDLWSLAGVARTLVYWSLSHRPLFPLMKNQTSQSLHPGGKYYPGGQRAQEKQTNHDTTTHSKFKDFDISSAMT